MGSPARPPGKVTGVVSLLVLGLGLSLLFLGVNWFWVVFAVGFAVVVPLVAVLTGEAGEGFEFDRTRGRAERKADEADGTDDPLATLRDRYARGELTEEQFERKVEALLETESPEFARERVERRRRERAAEEERER